MAFARVESVGEKSDLWRNATRSAAVGASMTELMEWVVVCVCGFGVTAFKEW